MNKREQQRLIREQKRQQAEKREKRNKMLTRVAAAILLPLLVIGALYGFMGQGQTYPPDQVAETDHTRGNPDGTILMVYADFQCPACAAEHLVMSQAWSRIADRVQLVFRHYPLTTTHRHAWTAALYAEAAGQQGKFWEMADMLFANQSYWSTLGDVSTTFDGYLAELSLDVEAAHVAMRSDEVQSKVRSDQRGGTRAGVRGTPALFVDGRLTPVPRTAADLIALVGRATSS